MQQQANPIETLKYPSYHFKEPAFRISSQAGTNCLESAGNIHMTTNESQIGQPGESKLRAYHDGTITSNSNITYTSDSHYYNNNNNNYIHLSNSYYNETIIPALNDQGQYAAYSDAYLNQHQQQEQATNGQIEPSTSRPGTATPVSSLQKTTSFDLNDIGAAIESTEIDYKINRHDQDEKNSFFVYPQEQQQEQQQQHEETEASIYEDLLKNIIETTSENGHSSAGTTQSPSYYSTMASNNHKTSDLLFKQTNADLTSTKPYVEILEQPSKCALRFRYKCEGRSAGSLPGVNSTADSKTYPTIRINNYTGRAVVVISCVTKDLPYRTHPHNIVGKEGCKRGICTIVLNGNNSQSGNDNNKNCSTNGTGDEPDATATTTRQDQTPSPAKRDDESSSNCIIRTFSSLGIQCVKRKDIEDSLNLRESINVDPFRNGFAHKLDTSLIDLNVVRLCFQVFIEGSTPNKCDIPLTPVVSDPIHDKKAMSDLVITKLSHCSAPATGGRDVILLCDRISKDDIQIRFFEESRDGKLIWETFSDISSADVHKQVAICFKTPKYYNEEITQPVMARIQLRRISDQQVSEPRLFQFLPCESDEDIISRKRKKVEWCHMNQYALDNIFLAAPSQLQVQQQQLNHPQHQQQQQQHLQQQQQQYQQHMQVAPQQQPHMSMMTQQSQQQPQ